MNLSYVVDTDWAIDHLNKVVRVAEKLTELRPQGVALSVISLAELYEGSCYCKDPTTSERMLRAFLRNFPVLGIDEEICQVFGKERGRLRKEGRMIGDFDLMIAATCLCHNLTLLTNNRKHFGMVEGLRIISLS